MANKKSSLIINKNQGFSQEIQDDDENFNHESQNNFNSDIISKYNFIFYIFIYYLDFDPIGNTKNMENDFDSFAQLNEQGIDPNNYINPLFLIGNLHY